VFVAYQVFGAGPFDVVAVPGFLSNIEFGWEFESWRNYYGTLASFARVILFDKRGTGVSDPVSGAATVEERMDDVRAVMDAAGSDRAALIGSADGAAMAALFAATYPDRTAALILNNPFVRGRWASDYPWGTRDDPDSAAFFADRWGGRQAIEEQIAEDLPGRVGDAEFARLFQSYQRLCASPTTFAKLLSLSLEIDVREALPIIRVPTLVTHVDPSRHSHAIASGGDALTTGVEASRYVAERVPGARFVELALTDPIVWAIDQREPLALFREFLTGAWQGGAWEPAEPDRILTTLLSPTSSTRRSGRRSSETRAGATWSSTTTHSSGKSSSAFADARSIRPVTASSRASMGPRAGCAARRRSSTQSPNSDSKRGPASIPVNARSSMASREGWRLSSERGSRRSPLPEPYWRRAPSRTSSSGQGSHSRTVVSTSSKACPAPGNFTPSSTHKRATSPRGIPHARASEAPAPNYGVAVIPD
jgi:pimeloyl-ACP methyl ester carboxylesterase